MFFTNKKKNKLCDLGKIVVSDSEQSVVNESYNRLKDNIIYINADGKNKVLQIESSMEHEGKTTILCNLAVALGLTDKKVAVVDLDFRRPRVQQTLNVGIAGGICEYMLDKLGKTDIIKHSAYKNVDVVTRGGEIHNSSLILVSDKFRTFIQELRSEYDFVLLDCAPVLQVSDYIHISQISDGVIFVVAYAATTRNQVSEAVKQLKKNGAKLLGTVFSMYDKKIDKAYGYGGSDYYKYTGKRDPVD